MAATLSAVQHLFNRELVPLLRRGRLLSSEFTMFTSAPHVDLAAGHFGLGFWQWNVPNDRLTADRHTAQVYGIDPAGEGMTQALARLVHPEDLAGVQAAFEQARAGRESSHRGRLVRPDGSVHHLELRAQPMFDAGGKVCEVLAVTSPERSIEAQRRLERASAWIQEGHWEIDLLTQTHWASPTYCTLLGYQPGELDVSTVEKVEAMIHPDDKEDAARLAAQHIESGAPYSTEVRVRTKDGSYRWFQLRVRAEQDAQGRPIRLAGSMHDIQKQRLAEESLQQARERFDRAVRGTQDGLWEWDQATRSLWFSPRYEAILGFDEGELMRIAQSAEAAVHEEDLDRFRAAQREHIAGNKPFDIEVRMRTRSGSYKWIRVHGDAERDEHGQPLRVSGSMQDVSEAREARDALILAKEAALAANRSKSDFLANVSHEIRTPMNGIIGMTSLLLDTRLDTGQRDFAETIRASADSLLSVINDILDFSKIEAGRLDIESIEMEPAANAREVAAIMGFQAAARGLELRVEVAPGVPSRAMGDPQRIRQCLVNLIGNAVKFTRKGQIVAELSLAGERGDCALVRYEVRDTGIGIEPSVLETLFQPFVQADSSTTRHFGGTGLGLSIVRRLAEMMGGEVGVESELGKGSRFWFILPLQRVAAETAAKRQSRSAAPAIRVRGRVLLVEDNAVNQAVARKFLERFGCEVTVVDNGLEAIETWQRGKFNLVLMDMQMPVMDGYAAAARIRELETAGSRTPIVALTANAMSGELERVTSAGMDGLLTKPLDSEELGRTLVRYCAADDSTELRARG
jgi:two-component system sensor histidine kinase/response regulator